MKMNLQTNQFIFGDRENELTNRAVQFRIDANAIDDELTHRSVHELQIKEMWMNLLIDQFIDYM
jgi:hypothetical protein